MKVNKINSFTLNSTYSQKTIQNIAHNSEEYKSNRKDNNEFKITKFPKYDDSFYKLERNDISTRIKSESNVGINFDLKV